MSSDHDIVLSVKNVSKCFEMYEKPVHRLYQTLCAGRKKFYKEFWALKDISFDVHRGECVGIIGRNGAGKSTVLQIITGTLAPTSGEVKVNGRIAALLELGSGFNPEFTGHENVYLNGAILGLSKEEIDKRYDDILAFADIGDFIDQPVKTYSSGMMVRLAFAVQVMVDPDVLIVDEALAVGDMFFQQKCLHYMKRLCERGCTLLFVSHSLGTVRSLCQRAILLRGGRIVCDGEASDVCNQYWNDSVDIVGGQPAAIGPEGHRTASSDAMTHQASGQVGALFREDPELGRKVSERIGSGDVVFTGFALYDKDGREVSMAHKGELLKVVASMKVKKDIPAGAYYAFSLGSRTMPGVLILHSGQCSMVLPELHVGERVVIQTDFLSPFFADRWFFNFSIKPQQDSEVYYEHVFNSLFFDAVLRPEEASLPVYGLIEAQGVSMSIEVLREEGAKCPG